MNLQFYLKKLEESEDFKRFIKENPKAFLCSGFFSIDKEGNDNKQHFDFFSKGKISSFLLEENSRRINLENLKEITPEKIEKSLDFVFEEAEKLIIERMKKEKIDKKIQKILFSLQNLNGKTLLIGTVFISGLGMIKANISLGDKLEITEFEKKSFFDMMKIFKKK